jgi:hypothetical protein
MNTKKLGYLLCTTPRASSSWLLKVKAHADFGFFECLKRTADLLVSVSIKYTDECIEEARAIATRYPELTKRMNAAPSRNSQSLITTVLRC